MAELYDFFRRAREALADHFPRLVDAQSMASDAGLRMADIDFSGAAAFFWKSILDVTEGAGKVDALLGLAIERAPARQELQDLREEYAQLVKALLVIDSPVHLELVRVSAGPFRMGSDPQGDPDAYPNETPQHTVSLPEYYIGKHPVTIRQFAEFVKATGHRTTAEKRGSGRTHVDRKFADVKGANWRHPDGPSSDVNGKDDHPVTQVSWDDARAFCQWLSDETGRPFRLPTEAEWEKAARGTDARRYPWGDPTPSDRLCNFNWNIGDTTPVSRYDPAGASPYGSLGMAGNAWEWTNTLRAPYKPGASDEREYGYTPPGEKRVVRGGAFDDVAVDVRSACRSAEEPGFSGRCVGFRVAATT
jgi:formylglycine-generating enzyme